VFSPGFVDILAAEQTPGSSKWYQGTADAVRQSFHHLENHEYDHLLVLSGDQLYQMDYEEMMQNHLAKGADISIATIPVNADDATSFGILKTDENGNISSFVEKPPLHELENWPSEVPDELKKAGRVYLASMGIYIFSKKAIYDLFESLPESTDFGKEIIPAAIESKYKVASFLYDGYWTDIGTIKSFFEANLDLTKQLPDFNLYDNKRVIFTRARLLPASKVTGTTLERSIIAEGSIIEASRIEHTLVGIRSRIGVGTTIVDSIVMGNDYFASIEDLKRPEGRPAMGIGERCYIRNAIIDKNVRIGNDVRINGGTHLEEGNYEKYSVVDGIVVVPKGVTLDDGFVV
jgi:glucose-1-phosphate adenylyltransferase